MIRYVLIVCLMLGLGVVLAQKLYYQSQLLDEALFQKTKESIHELAFLSRELSLLIREAKFKINFDHGTLLTTNNIISDQFDALRFDLLAREIADDTKLHLAIEKYEAFFIQHEEELEAYIQTNSNIGANLKSVSSLTQELQNQNLGKAGLTIRSVLGNTNASIYLLAVSNTPSNNLRSISRSLNTLFNNLNADLAKNIKQTLSAYSASVTNIVADSDQLHQQLKLLTSLGSNNEIDQIETAYTDYYEKSLLNLRYLKMALIAYASCLLAGLFFCAYKIWQTITRQRKQTRAIAGRIHQLLISAATHLNTARAKPESISTLKTHLNTVAKLSYKTDINQKLIQSELQEALNIIKSNNPQSNQQQEVDMALADISLALDFISTFRNSKKAQDYSY